MKDVCTTVNRLILESGVQYSKLETVVMQENDFNLQNVYLLCSTKQCVHMYDALLKKIKITYIILE